MASVIETLAKLPELCATRHVTTGETILIRRGVMGYYPFPGKDPDQYNARHGITTAQVLAMEVGSMFGWEVPSADPDNY